jgi:uncharacterized protein
MTAADTVVIIFARAPQPGMAKTRLIPLLGAEGAARLQARLSRRTLETARAASLGRMELHCDPDPNHPFFHFCAAHYGPAMKMQGQGDLGARMLAAIEQGLHGAARVLLTGTDCPALSGLHLAQADRALHNGNDAVFVPCEDGGYALIGLKRAEASLFDGIAWGGEEVMSTTRKRLTALGWRWHELETLWDVDRPDDYSRLMASGLLDD